MSKFSDWLADLIDRLFPPKPPAPPPKPAPPVPPPIVPPSPGPDVLAARALAAMNARLASKGLGPLAWDAGLAAGAMELAVPLGKGQAEPHQDFPGRVRRHGWPYKDEGIRNHGFGNVSEGISWGGRTPEQAVLILDDDPNPREPHRWDFEDPQFSHVGIAIVPNGPGLATTFAPRSPSVPWTLASAAVCGPDGEAIVPARVAAMAAALGGGYTSIGGYACVVDYGSRRKN